MIGKKWLLMAAALIYFCGCGSVPVKTETPVSSEEMLAREIVEILTAPETGNAFWGVLIKRLGEEKPLLAINENKCFMPASNMKLYSTASTLTLLGKDHRFETVIYHTGEIDQTGTLHGDIVLQGGGDPAISGRYRKDVMTEEILDEWCTALEAGGIRSVKGNVIGDDDFFTDEEVEGTWQVSNLSYWYTAPSSALSINDNLYQFYMLPGEAEGEKARIEEHLGTSYMDIQNDVITTGSKAGIRVWFKRDVEGNRLRVSGQMPLEGGRERVRGCVYNATLFSAFLFREAMEKHGITVSGEAMDIDEFEEEEKEKIRGEVKILHVHLSPPLPEILRIINKPSQNYYADMLLKNLGKRFRDEGSFDEGYEVVMDFLRMAGALDVENFQMKDGSGLSRRNLVQPRHTVALLEYMAGSENFELFYDSLPIAGVDGTIGRRMRKPPARGNVHAKTGFISHARALSGYVDDRNGDRWVFSMMCNHFTVSSSRIDALIDRVCQALASYGE